MAQKEDPPQQAELAPQGGGGFHINGRHGGIGGDVVGGNIGSIGDIHQILTLVVSSGIAAGAYNLLKSWVDARNGRRLKLKIGDIEVEATQMPEENVLRLLELLQANADQRKIRDLLLQASSTKITSLGAARFITATKELRGPPMLVTPVPA